MKDPINALFDALITELNIPHDSKLLRNLQFHVCIDAMGYISMPEEQLENNSQDYKNWFKNYLFKVFSEKKRQFTRFEEVSADQLAEAFWNDRCAKIHKLSHVSNRYTDTGAVIKIDNYSDGFMKNLSKPSKKVRDGGRILYFVGKQNLVEDMIIALNNYRNICLELDEDDYRVNRIKEINISFSSR